MTNMLNNANFEDYLKLSEKQQEYIRIKSETKKTDKVIAKKIGVNITTISRWKRKEDYRIGLRGYQAEHLANTVPKSIQTMIDLLGAKSELIKFQTAKDIIDRTGYNPVDKQEMENKETVVFNDSIDRYSCLISKHFHNLWRAARNGDVLNIVAKGGRGSGKSSDISHIIVQLIMRYPLNTVVVRKTDNTLATSVFEQIKWAIEEQMVSHLFKVKVSPMEITYKSRGNRIIFRGSQNP